MSSLNKACTVCGATKPADEFYKNPKSRGGRLNQCIPCVRAARQKYRVENQEKIREQHRLSYQRNRDSRIQRAAKYYQENPEVNHTAVLRYRARNPEAAKAREAVAYAVRKGRLRPLPCQECGFAFGTQAHHEDYSKPLDVTWLCRTCHGRRHRQINEERRASGC